MKMKLFGLNDTKLFHFHRIFKNRSRRGGSLGSAIGVALTLKVELKLRLSSQFEKKESGDNVKRTYRP